MKGKERPHPVNPFIHQLETFQGIIESKLKGDTLSPQDREWYEQGLQSIKNDIADATATGNGQMVGQKTVNDSRNGQNKFGK